MFDIFILLFSSSSSSGSSIPSIPSSINTPNIPSNSTTKEPENKNSYSSDINVSLVSAIAAASIVVSWVTKVTVSLSSGGSPQSVWSIINFYQYFILFPMIGPYVPDVIINFIQGVDFWMFNFNFISLPKSGVSGSFLSFFSWEESSSYLSSIGIDSLWMIVNQIKLFLTFILFIFLHIPIFLILRRQMNDRTRCGKLSKFIFMIFTFTIYLRTIIEAYFIVFKTNYWNQK